MGDIVSVTPRYPLGPEMTVKIAIFVLFEGHLGAEGVVIGAWTLYDVRQFVRRAFEINRYVALNSPWHRK